MTKTDLWSRLGRKGTNPEKMADVVYQQRHLLSHLLEGLDAAEPGVKFGCAKVLCILSRKEPMLLYPHVDLFIGLLGASHDFLRWDAIRVVANLAAVDERGRIEQILDGYLEPIRGPVMVTATTTMQSAAVIALAKPALATAIARAILKVQWADYESTECRNVAIAEAIDSFDRFFERVEYRKEILTFVREQAENPRTATRKRATQFLEKHDR